MEENFNYSKFFKNMWIDLKKNHDKLMERNKKISDALKGRKMSEETKQKLRKPLTEERKQKLSIIRKELIKNGKIVPSKGMLGKHHSENVKMKISLSLKGRQSPMKGRVPWNKKMTKETDERMKTISRKVSKTLKGKYFGSNCPNWLGGISFEPYTPEFNRSLKEQIRQRDNFTCQLCDLKENGHKLSVHHIDYDKKNCNPSNLISLCRIPCNTKVNFNREYWKSYFQTKIRSDFV